MSVRHRERAGRNKFALVGGVTGIAMGVVMLLVVGYELYGTDHIFAQGQQRATDDLLRQWQEVGPSAEPPADGVGMARLYAPTVGAEFAYTVLEGTTPDILADGPGHYSGTAMPGETGNFAVAGHRVTHGAPFTNIDRLQSCDPLVVETATAWFVYRVLPLSDEVQGWTGGKGAQSNCRGVAPLPPPYRDVPGQQIVAPDAVSVVAPDSGLTSKAGIAAAGQAQLITLTTCHPEFSARERLIVHGVLVAQYPHTGQRPSELDAEVIR